MKKSDFWFVSLCALLVIACATGLNIFARVAVAANAVVVLLEVIGRVVELCKRGKEDDTDGGAEEA